MASGHMFYVHTYLCHGGHIYIHSLFQWPIKLFAFLEQLAYMAPSYVCSQVAQLDLDNRISD